MKISLSDISLSNAKVKISLLSYLDRIRSFDNFDDRMLLHIFVNSSKDFCAFEAVNYRIQFTSSAHKLTEIISSPFVLDYVPFSDFYNFVLVA